MKDISRLESHVPCFKYFQELRQFDVFGDAEKLTKQGLAIAKAKGTSHGLDHIYLNATSRKQVQIAHWQTAMHEEMGGQHIEYTNATVELLSRFMKLDSSLTASLIQPPADNCYLSFGDSPQACPYFIKDESGTTRKLQGAFVNTMTYSPEQCKKIGFMQHEGLHPQKDMRALNITLYFSAYDDGNNQFDSAVDVYFMQIVIYLYDEEASIIELIQEHLAYYKDRLYLFFSQNHEDQTLLEFLFTSIFYLSSKSLRKEVKNEATELAAEIKRKASNKAKVRKLEKRLTRTTDRIIIGEKDYSFLRQFNERTRGTVKPHFRRGHLRKTTQEKIPCVITIYPTLVNAKLSSEVTKKDYKV